MIAALLAIVIACAAGAPLARLAERDADLPRLIGQAYLLGLGLIAAILFAVSMAGVPWTLTTVLVPLAFVTAVFYWTARHAWTRPVPARLQIPDVFTIGTLAGYGIWATLAPLHDFDFLIIWGLKARQFLEHGGIDREFLTNTWYPWSHHDYPILLPLTFDFVALLNGVWDDRWIGLLYVGFAAALLMIVRSLLREELGSSLHASVATLILAPLAVTPWPGRADGPVAVFATAGLLLARRSWRLRTTEGLTASALLLGLAAVTKNEGMTFLAAAAVALLADPRMPRRTVLRLWPAVAILTPWLLVRFVWRIPTDLAEGDVATRLVTHATQLGTYVQLLAKYTTGQPLLWLGIGLALLVGARRVVREERIVIIAAGLQLAAFIGAYLVTPLDVEWHVRFSWERLVAQITPLLVVTALILLAPLLRRERHEPV